MSQSLSRWIQVIFFIFFIQVIFFCYLDSTLLVTGMDKSEPAKHPANKSASVGGRNAKKSDDGAPDRSSLSDGLFMKGVNAVFRLDGAVYSIGKCPPSDSLSKNFFCCFRNTYSNRLVKSYLGVSEKKNCQQ